MCLAIFWCKSLALLLLEFAICHKGGIFLKSSWCLKLWIIYSQFLGRILDYFCGTCRTTLILLVSRANLSRLTPKEFIPSSLCFAEAQLKVKVWARTRFQSKYAVRVLGRGTKRRATTTVACLGANTKERSYLYRTDQYRPA